MVTLEEKLKELKLDIIPKFNVGPVRNGSTWFIGREFFVGNTLVQTASFGKWGGERGTWRNEASTTLTPEGKKEFEEQLAAMNEEERLEREAKQEAVAKEAELLWNEASDRGTHPYIERKKLAGLHGGRISINADQHPVLLVPMRDGTGKLWNVTRIYTKKFEGTNSDKFVIKGGKKQGVWHLLGEIRNESTVYITEGFSTGASVFEALGNQPVVIAFDAGNLGPVAEAIRTLYPECRLVFCADNDQWKRDARGQIINAGKTNALKAASQFRGSVILPRFTDEQLEKKPTDFNDLHLLAGLKEVAEQLTNPKHMVQEVVPLPTTGKGAKAKVSEKAIANALLDQFADSIVAFEQDLFIYRQGYWNLLNFSERNRLKQLIGRLAPDYGIRDIEAAFKYFLTYCPVTPPGVNMFQPSPDRANFENGTLHISRVKQKYVAEFKPHNPEDYLTSKLPFNYIAPGAGGRNEEFDAMLQRVWAGDADIEGKIRLYKQVLGACLCPAFPIIVFFVGNPGTGKSTLIKMLARLVSPENSSTVDPSDFKGFLMESMIGKLLNFNTDIDLSHPMQDAMVKKIIDRVPVQVNRKHEKTVFAYLPAVHAFAGNGLPRTLDGESRAYGRRMIIIKTDKFQPAIEHDLEFDQFVWEAGPEGIISAALEGLMDLLESRGHYHRPESNSALVKEMQDRNDPVAVFLGEVDQGRIKDKNANLTRNSEGRIERSHLWELFDNWRKHEDKQAREMGRNHFFQRIESRGLTTVRVKGIHFVKGLQVGETEGSLC